MAQGKSSGGGSLARAADRDDGARGGPTRGRRAASTAAVAGPPRVLYIDADSDLPAVLDRVEEAGTAAILVLPDGARGVRGAVAARLLKRRADAAGIPVVAVTTDRATIGGLGSAGIRSASTVGEARRLLPHPMTDDEGDPLAGIAWEDDDEDAQDLPHDPDAGQMPRAATGADAPTLVALPAAPQDADDEDDVEDDDTAPSPGTVTQGDVGGVRTVRRPRAWRRWLIGSLAGLAVALIAIGVWAVFFPAATITITYALRPFDRSFAIPLGSGPSAIRLYHTHLTMTSTMVVPGTGTQLVPDGHASGTIALANPLDGVVHVPAGTVVDAQNGARFATVQDVDVPAAVHSFSGTTNGQASVPVQAVLAGPASNVADHTITAIEGRLAGALLVTNPAPMTGGTMRTVYSLTPADTAAPIAAMTRDLVRREADTLNRRYARSPIRLLGTPRAARPIVIPFDQAGRPYARITESVRTDLDYIHAGDALTLATARQDAELAGLNQRVVPGSERLQLSEQTHGKTTVVVIHAQARIAPSIDAADLRARLVGRSEDDARQLLDGSARNGNWTYTMRISPDLAHRLPQAAGLITIDIRQLD